MSNEKKVGRPRKYATRSERQKAYHERKKEKMELLEHKVKQLEKQDLFSSGMNMDIFDEVELQEIPNFNWKKITPSEIALMGTQELEALIDEFHERVEQLSILDITLENIILGMMSKNYLLSKNDSSTEQIKQIDSKIKNNIKALEDRIQQQTLLYLLEAELSNRSRIENRKAKLDIFEAKIDELEKGIEKERIKIKKEIKE